MEHTNLKTWLVANQKVWGFVPAGICLAIAFGLATLFGKNEETVGTMVEYLVLGTLFLSLAFNGAEAYEKPNLLYGLIAFFTICWACSVLVGDSSHTLITTGVAIWTTISALVALYFGFIIGKYSLVNYDEAVSAIFKLRSSIDIWSSKQSFAFRRGVEAFMYTFATLEMFAVLFV